MANTNIANLITKLAGEGKSKAAIEGKLICDHNFTVNKAKAEVQAVLGKGSSGGAEWHEDVVAFIRQNYGKISKADLIAGMCDISGQKQSSMNHCYNYIKFAQEYARQEVEASK